MSPDGWFRKRSKAAVKATREHIDSLPDGLWTKCPKCGEILFSKELEKNLKVCNKCGSHFKLRAAERLNITVDPDSFVEINSDLITVDPFNFPKYREKLNKDTVNTGLNDGMITGTATIDGIPVVIGIADFNFIGGSMGSVYGEKVARAFEKGIEENRSVIMINSSGGARMQEGILSLMQMAKTSAAVAQLNQAGLMYISVLTDPTTAGVLASFAMLADVTIAEPDALVAFTGQRVAAQAQVAETPPGYQRSEFQYERGMIDMIVPRKEIKDTLLKVLTFSMRGGINGA
ncbi:MAG: acetyl-CoA carboxylase, carboxyltransferase subunit beta [Armatimonadota bacterium]